MHRKFRRISYALKKSSGQGRTAAERNYVAKATRRRRRISQARFFFIVMVFHRQNVIKFRI
jgi:hypothetical protein